MYSSINCYNQSGTPLLNNAEPWLRVPSFTVSVTKNKFVAVGCDTYAYLNGYVTDEPFSIGCLSKCNNTHNIVNGNCSGIGCCQIDIPEGLKNIDFVAYSFNSHKDVWSFNPCSFAFIIQRDKFNFSSAYLTSLQNNRTLPMVLDWAIGNETCEVARNKGNYICGANSTCSDHNNSFGYHCNCEQGYEGTSKTVAKVYIQFTYISRYRTIFQEQLRGGGGGHIFNKFLTYILCYNTFHVSFWFQQFVIAFGYCIFSYL